MNFEDYNFGLADAYEEYCDQPHLIEEGILDSRGWIKSIQQGTKFLILGKKGSGKTAIGSKLLQTSSKGKFVAQYQQLSSFPFNQFTGIMHMREAPEINYTEAWDFVLLLALCSSFANDETVGSFDPREKKQLFDLLKNLNFISNNNLSSIVQKTKEKTYKTDLKIFSSETKTETEDLNAQKLLTILRPAVMNFAGDTSHLLIIDGLDDVLTKRQVQYEALTALILSAKRLNSEFNLKHVPAKIILLCRTDVFEKLRTPNKNKIIQDNAIELDWYFDMPNPEDSDLIKIANLRASNSSGGDIDIFSKNLPKSIKGKNTMKCLIDYTRYTPRDFISLLKCIQRVSPGKEKITELEIWKGLTIYSEDYFLREVKDELTGFIENEEVIHLLFNLLVDLGKKEFTFNEIQKKASKDRYKGIDLKTLLDLLYERGVIGNFENTGANRFYRSKYRNKHSQLDFEEMIFIHKALHKVLTLR